MKVLIDTCMAGSVAPALAEAGHDVECVADWPPDPGDAAILAHAQNTGQVVITLDKDFGELAVVRGQPHSGSCALSGSRRRNSLPSASRSSVATPRS